MVGMRHGVSGFARVAVLTVLLAAGAAVAVALRSTAAGEPEKPLDLGPRAENFLGRGSLVAAVVGYGFADTTEGAESRVAAAGDEFFITTAAHVSGAAGTNWRTDVEVHNYGGIQASYTIAVLKRDTNNASPLAASYLLNAGQSARYVDVMGLWGWDGGGAVRVTCTGGSILVTSRTYNDQPTGTFGQFVRARPLADAIGYGEQGRIIQLTHNRSASAGYRTNLLFVNATNSSMQFVADLYRADGTYLGQQQRTMMPYEYKQIDKVFETVTGGDVNDAYIIVTTPTLSGRFFAACSVIDNRTGDAIFIPHEKVTGSGGGTTTTTSIPTTTSTSTTTSSFTTTTSSTTTTVPSSTTTTVSTGSFWDFAFSTDVDDWTGEPINPGTSFPYGATRLYATWKISGVTIGTPFDVRWYQNGSLYWEGSYTFQSSAGNMWNYLYLLDGSPLSPATYRFDLVVGGIVKLTGQCVITTAGSLTGTWVGTIQDSMAGRGSVRMTIQQNGSSLSGTWSATFSNSSYNNGGTATGTVNGSAISAVLYGPNSSVCPFAVTATWSGNRITGTYAAYSCSQAITGSIDVSRQ